MPKRKTRDEFIADAKAVHGGRYDYSLVEYEKTVSRVRIVCPQHGEFLQTPYDHLNGCGCKSCGYNKNACVVPPKVGDRFGKLTILEPNSTQNKFRHRRSRVRCDCGFEYDIRTRDVVSGLTQFCKKCRTESLRIQPIIGARFGEWEVVSSETLDTSYHRKFRVRCHGCEKLYWISHVTLRCGDSQSCRTCERQQRTTAKYARRVGELSPTYLVKLKIGCTRGHGRVLEFSVTAEQLWELYLQQNKTCALSGLPIDVRAENFTASLDRRDSSKGYTLDNVQWLHKDVNRIKMDLEESYFIHLCKLIANVRS